MTLSDFVKKGGLTGRVVQTNDKSGYIFCAVVGEASEAGGKIRLQMTEVLRCFVDKGAQGPWKHLPDFPLDLAPDLRVETCRGTVSFTLPDGGRGYFLPDGKESPEKEND